MRIGTNINRKEDILVIKICSLCNKSKNITEFYSRKAFSKSKGNYVYYHPECKCCTAAKATKWRKENPDRYKEICKKNTQKPERKMKVRGYIQKYKETGGDRKWRLANRDKLLEYVYDKYTNRTHTITDEEWISCKDFFENACAYCGLNIEDHYIIYGGKPRKTDLHREHVDDQGANDLSNCIPSCRSCNSRKWVFKLDDWYNEDNENYTIERRDRIKQWLDKFN